jgi:hypothetical protein
MTQKALSDRLMDLVNQNAEQIAGQWHKSVTTNLRTPSFCASPKEGCLRHATFLYKNLKRMYFADNPFQEVQRVMAEAVYALILMRRYVWLYAESSALFDTGLDMYAALQSTNRILLLFDYAVYTVIDKYEKMSKR